jgi:hypothetical protein
MEILMSDYANQLNIQIAEVVRLTFNDMSPQGELLSSIQIVVHCDFIKTVSEMIAKTVKDHEEALAKQVEANRKMN